MYRPSSVMKSPRIELFRHALHVAGSPDDSCMIGDNPVADIQGGKAAGMNTILVHQNGDGSAGCASAIRCPKFLPCFYNPDTKTTSYKNALIEYPFLYKKAGKKTDTVFPLHLIKCCHSSPSSSFRISLLQYQ